MRQILKTAALPQPRFRYSTVVCAHGFAFVSGLVGLDPSSGQLAKGGAGAETRQILNNFLALLAEQRWSLDQVVFARVFCSDFANFPAVNAEWEKVFASVQPPARTSVGVQQLPLQARVEIEFQIAISRQ
jgi:2-iminobutanoate/2-iminopropanoate deaminase